MREYVVENEFVKAVRKAGGVAYKLTSQTANGLPDRLVLFFPAKCIFVELKAPGKQLRPLQRKRRYQLMKLGFPVLCIDRLRCSSRPCEASKGAERGRRSMRFRAAVSFRDKERGPSPCGLGPTEKALTLPPPVGALSV